MKKCAPATSHQFFDEYGLHKVLYTLERIHLSMWSACGSKKRVLSRAPACRSVRAAVPLIQVAYTPPVQWLTKQNPPCDGRISGAMYAAVCCSVDCWSFYNLPLVLLIWGLRSALKDRNSHRWVGTNRQPNFHGSKVKTRVFLHSNKHLLFFQQ